MDISPVFPELNNHCEELLWDEEELNNHCEEPLWDEEGWKTWKTWWSNKMECEKQVEYYKKCTWKIRKIKKFTQNEHVKPRVKWEKGET